MGGLGATELLIIGAIIVMMFGASKLPELARGSGQALRIFKSETKGLMDDDEKDAKHTRDATDAPATPVVSAAPVPPAAPVVEPAPTRSTLD
ncbi:twin-arginine translocase TatA/TatE family subunit [Nocardioides currus]|uniref:Sec-independent protein translocase protein TatA n=1 Tax=Nocardioides currus TaxID=2133958 RepID=A0A2R7Z362_9ACTN|nr:twin-arginine translocase TatA/TatE family subunit [Nocardioides currus]